MSESLLKRKAASGSQIVKRQRTEDGQLVKLSKDSELPAGRSSSLSEPSMLLKGHKGEVMTARFNPAGDVLATGGFDKDILLWKIYGQAENYSVIKGHKSAVLELHWTTDGKQIVSCSADKTLGLWDVEAEERVARWNKHGSFVNSCCPNRRGNQLVVSGSDDRTAKVWDTRQKRRYVHDFDCKYPVTSVCFSDNSEHVFCGGLDNTIQRFSLVSGQRDMVLSGHSDTITGLSLSPDGNFILSNSCDNTLRMWDVRPYVSTDRCVSVFVGALHSMEKNLLKCGWSPDGSMVTAGSSDRNVYIWDAQTRRVRYRLPGHTACVNEAVFHPREPIIASASSDKNVFLGEFS